MSGLVLLNKPAGATSFRATAAVRRVYGERKAGHSGTLDPLATGVLPVLLGSATRLARWLLDGDKRYTATLRLGLSTDTLDITGNVVEERPVNVSPGEFAAVLPRFSGEISQTPPAYSAIKRDGVPLYKLARAGETVEPPPREVTVYSLELTGYTPPGNYTFAVRCSRGTYIRSLARDIGEVLGCGATLTALRRDECCGFTLEDCATLEEISREPDKYLLPASRAVAHMPPVEVTPRQAERFRHGGSLDPARLAGELREGVPVRVCFGEELLGVAALRDGALSPLCVL